MPLAFIHCKKPGVTVVKEHDHIFTTEVTPPTCTEKGYTTYTCECGHIEKKDYVDALGHDFSGEWQKDADGHWKECSCGEKSEFAAHIPGDEATKDSPQVCTVCGYVLATYEEHIHNWGEWETVTAATCYKAGEQKRTCPICGETETEEIPKRTHLMTSTVITQPTCEKDGTRYWWCTHDGCGHTATSVIAKTGHKYTHHYSAWMPFNNSQCVRTAYCSCGAWTNEFKSHSYNEGRVCNDCGHGYVPT